MQTALIVRRTCVWLCSWNVSQHSGTFPPFLSEGSKSYVNPQISARGPSQAVGWAVRPWAVVLVSHSLRGSDARDTFLQHRSSYKRKSVLSFPSWGFSGCALRAGSGRKSLRVRACVGQTLGPGGCQKSGINEHWGSEPCPDVLCVSLGQAECAVMSSPSRAGRLSTSILVKMYEESELLFKESFVWT